MVKAYGLGAVFESGLCDRYGKANYVFVTEGMTIMPYLHESGDVYFYKSHKLGSLKGHKPIPYCSKIYKSTPKHDHDTLVICEGELKAAAMWQLGWRAVGLGGISTFSGELFDRIEYVINEIKPNKTIVLFDTEVQTDPSTANYKDHFSKRYRQLIYAYIISKKIQLKFENIKSLVAQLPEEWMIENKADIDGCLAAGRTDEEFKIILKDAVDPETFRKIIKVDKEHYPIVERRMERAFNRANIWTKDNCYYANKIERIKGEQIKTPIEISNFTVKLKNSIIKQGKTYRSIDLISRFGDARKNVIINEVQLSSVNRFKEFLISQGDFMWKGSEMHLSSMVEDMFLDNLDIPINICDYVGRDEANKMWIYDNMIIRDDGKIIKPDKEGIIWDSVGYKVDPINILNVKTSLPKIYDGEINAKEIVDNMWIAYQLPGLVSLCWAIATVFSNDIVKTYQAFPILFIYGEKESGKSTLSDILMEICGMPSSSPANNICETTQVGMTRLLSYYHSIPVRFDEYRESDKKTSDKLSLLRSIYNRQGAGKGIRETFGIRQVEINAPMMLIGEQFPTDPALASRIVLCQLALKDKSPATIKALKWLYSNKEKLSGLIFSLIKDYKKNIKVILDKIDAAKTDMSLYVEEVVNIRNQIHYSILMSVLDMIYPDCEQKGVYFKQIFKLFEITNDTIKNSSSIAQFFDEVYNMHITQPKYDCKPYIDVIKDSGEIYLRGIHGLLMQYMVAPKDSLFFFYNNLANYFEKQPWCTGTKRRLMNDPTNISNNRRLNYFAVNLKHPDVPDGLLNLFGEKGYDTYKRNPKFDEQREVDDIFAEDDFSERVFADSSRDS